MAKARKKLDDKLERIMVQAQLMGLTTADMITISNRMKALEHERELKAEIDGIVSRFSYKDRDGGGWVVTDTDTGRVYHAHNRDRKYRNDSWNTWPRIEYDVTVEKPGTRMHPFTKKGYQLQFLDAPARLMPDNNKELYAIMTAIKRGHLEKP